MDQIEWKAEVTNCVFSRKPIMSVSLGIEIKTIPKAPRDMNAVLRLVVASVNHSEGCVQLGVCGWWVQWAETAAEARCLRSPTERSSSGVPAVFAWCQKTAPSTAPSPWTSRSGCRIKRWAFGRGYLFDSLEPSQLRTTEGSYLKCQARPFRFSFIFQNKCIDG